MPSHFRYCIRVVFLLTWWTIADLSPSTQEACRAIAKNSSIVFYPADGGYTTENSQYWSYVLTEVKPACIAMPTSVAI